MNRCAEHPRGDPCPLLPEWAQAQIATLQSQLAEREAELKRRELKIQQLTLELAHHRRIRFGARSEVLGAEQRELFLDSRAEDEAAILAELEQQRAARPARQAKRTGRHPLPSALPRIEHRYEPASCTCGTCGAGLVKIGEDTDVLFRVRAYAQGGQKRTLRLAGTEFIARFLLHVLPSGFKRIRDYGLLLSPARKEKGLAAARAALNVAPPAPAMIESVSAFLLRVARIEHERCPHCGQGQFRLVETIPAEHRPGNPRGPP